MRIFKNVDEKLKEIGFNKISEDKHGAQYERYNTKYNYWQRVDIWHKASGRHILQSYDRDLMDEKKIGNTNVGLTGYEMKLFLAKMKKLGLYSKTAGIEGQHDQHNNSSIHCPRSIRHNRSDRGNMNTEIFPDCGIMCYLNLK